MEHVTTSCRLSATTIDPSNVDQSRQAWRRKMTNTVDSKVTPNDSWLDIPSLFLLTAECQVPPDRDFRSDAPIERIIQLQMPIVRKFNDLKPMTLIVTSNQGFLLFSTKCIQGRRWPCVQTGVSRGGKGAFPYPCGEFTNMYIKQGLPSWIGEY